MLSERQYVRRSCSSCASHHRDCIPPAADCSRIRPTAGDYRLQQPEPSARRILRDHHNGRTRTTKGRAGRMWHNTDRCGRTKYEGTRHRCRRSSIIPALRAGEDGQRIMKRYPQEVHEAMVLRYDFTLYYDLRVHVHNGTLTLDYSIHIASRNMYWFPFLASSSSLFGTPTNLGTDTAFKCLNAFAMLLSGSLPSHLSSTLLILPSLSV